MSAGLFGFRWEISCLYYCGLLYVISHFSFAALKILFLYFDDITIKYLGVDLSEFILFGISWVSWMCGFISFIKFAMFQPLLLQIFFLWKESFFFLIFNIDEVKCIYFLPVTCALFSYSVISCQFKGQEYFPLSICSFQF